MTAKEIRALTGQVIEWETIPDHFRGYYDVRSGVVREVKGRNLRVEIQGDDIWLWIPNMRNVHLKAKPIV